MASVVLNQRSLTDQLSANGASIGGSGIVSVGPVTMSSPAQAGVATIALGSATIAVALPAITADSIIVLTGRGAPDATATSFNAVLNSGIGFAITANANATAAKVVSWFVVRY
jgi:hypothetical protein